jgi:ribosomal protein S27E
MFNKPSASQLASLPQLYQTEDIPLKDKLVHLHFFIGGTDFFICEYNGTDTFWGFAILNGDYEMAEFGYINFDELKSIRVNGWQEIDCDRHWQVRPTSQVKIICIPQGWTLPENSTGVEIQCPNCMQVILSGSEDDVSCPECKVVILQHRINSVDQGGAHHGIYT